MWPGRSDIPGLDNIFWFIAMIKIFSVLESFFKAQICQSFYFYLFQITKFKPFILSNFDFVSIVFFIYCQFQCLSFFSHKYKQVIQYFYCTKSCFMISMNEKKIWRMNTEFYKSPKLKLVEIFYFNFFKYQIVCQSIFEILPLYNLQYHVQTLHW